MLILRSMGAVDIPFVRFEKVKESKLLAVIMAGVEGKLERVRACRLIDWVKVLKFVEEILICRN